MKEKLSSEHRSAPYMGERITTCRICGETNPEMFRKRERRGRCKTCWKAIKVKDPLWREKQAEKDRQPRNRYSRGRAFARSRGITWLISFEDWSSLIQKPCDYCGGELEPTGAGMDRIDSVKEYTAKNVVPCCGACNITRARMFSYWEMKNIVGPAIRAVREYRAANGLAPINAYCWYGRKGTEFRR